VEHGKPLETRMRKEHININDVLLAARKQQGLLHLTQIEYAILESSGGISIIPASEATQQDRVDRTTSSPDG
ncbi:YetF domain-containing protein, partial [Saccharomonospora sp.]|uniref:YetF domain-containing protein n=1 Tax=Saccharomonospora sp. TaxID=33913 RepID=UPI00260EC340